jgi:hypothetical protein
MALDVPESWWQYLNIVDHVLVIGGHEELFRDHIVQFVEVLRRKSSVDLTSYIALDEAHDGPLRVPIFATVRQHSPRPNIMHLRIPFVRCFELVILLSYRVK